MLAILSLIQQRIPINFFSIMMLYWLRFKLVTLCFPVLNVKRFLLVSFSILLRMAAQHSLCVYQVPLHVLMTSGNVEREHSVPSSRLLMKMLNRIGSILTPGVHHLFMGST